MKLKYNSEDDILVIVYSKEAIDDVLESRNMLIHVNKNQQPILIEVHQAAEFVKNLSKTLPSNFRKELLAA